MVGTVRVFEAGTVRYVPYHTSIRIKISCQHYRSHTRSRSNHVLQKNSIAQILMPRHFNFTRNQNVRPLISVDIGNVEILLPDEITVDSWRYEQLLCSECAIAQVFVPKNVRVEATARQYVLQKITNIF